jgi:MFS family permease
MASSQIAAAFARRNIHYGWMVVAVTFLTLLVTAAAMGTPGVMIVPLEREFGWSDAQISSALALRILLFGLFGPFAAAFMNRFGIRRVIVCALALIAAGLLISLMMTQIWQLVLLLGILAASSATGQLLFLPVIAEFTTRFGWRPALILIAAALGATSVLVLTLMRDRPSDLDLPLYGETAVTPDPTSDARLASLLLSPLVTLRECARVPIFWVLFGTFFVCGCSTNGLIQTHFVALCHDYGLAATAAASVLAMMGAFDFVGTIGSGWLSDRFDNRWLLFWYYGLRGLSLLYLPFTDFTFYGLSLFAVFYGLDWIATVPPTVKLTADRFGRERAGMVFGWIFTGHQIGAASAALAAGIVRTDFLTYLPAFFAAGALCIVAALLILSVPRPAARRITAAMPLPARG